MKCLIFIILLSIAAGQKIDVYDRPFQPKPDFNIDVQHYDINLSIYDHVKSFRGKTSVQFKVVKSSINSIRFDVETFRVALSETVSSVVKNAMKLLGVEVPNQM